MLKVLVIIYYDWAGGAKARDLGLVSSIVQTLELKFVSLPVFFKILGKLGIFHSWIAVSRVVSYAKNMLKV